MEDKQKRKSRKKRKKSEKESVNKTIETKKTNKSVVKKKTTLFFLCVSLLLNVLLGGLLVIVGYWFKIPYLNYLEKIFFNKDGFNWTSVTALVALIGVVITVVTHYSGLNANLIGKERTRWLGNHKHLISDYISEINNYINLLLIKTVEYKELTELENKGQLYPNESERKMFLEKREIDHTLELNKLYIDIYRLKTLLNMELHYHDDNKEFLNRINSLHAVFAVNVNRILNLEANKIEELEKLKKRKDIISINEKLEKLSNTASDYYYNVWNVIKSNN